MFVQVVDIFDACWHPAYLVMLLSLLSSLNHIPLFLSFLHSIIPSLPSLLSFFVQLFLPLLSSFYHFFPSFLPSLLRNFLPFFLPLFIRSIFLPFSFLSRRRIRRHCHSSFYKRLRCARNFLLFKKHLVTALIFFKKRKIWN